MIITHEKGKWLVDTRTTKNGKSFGCRKTFNTQEEAVEFMVATLEDMAKTKLSNIDNIAVFDNHGDLVYLKEKVLEEK